MKRYLELFLMALGIPAVFWAIAGIATLALMLMALCGCVWQDMEGNTYAALPLGDKQGDLYQVQLNRKTHYYLKGEAVDPKYANPSESAPDSLKPYYDAKLTQALNR